jgi:hypothetical protein
MTADEAASHHGDRMRHIVIPAHVITGFQQDILSWDTAIGIREIGGRRCQLERWPDRVPTAT